MHKERFHLFIQRSILPNIEDTFAEIAVSITVFQAFSNFFFLLTFADLQPFAVMCNCSTPRLPANVIFRFSSQLLLCLCRSEQAECTTGMVSVHQRTFFVNRVVVIAFIGISYAIAEIYVLQVKYRYLAKNEVPVPV